MNPKWNHECSFWNQAEGDTTLKEMEAEMEEGATSQEVQAATGAWKRQGDGCPSRFSERCTLVLMP